MQEIKDILPKALETLAPKTPEEEANTQTLRENSPTPDLEFRTLDDPCLAKMARTADNFCRDLYANQNPRWLSFLGRAGTGKTHLAKRISRYFRKHLDGFVIPGQDPDRTRYRMRGGFASWRLVANDVRAGDRRLLTDLGEDWFVVLDDIGAEYKSKTDFMTAKLDDLLDARLGKWTVITANLSLAEIGEHMDVRIASRMLRQGSEVIDVDVPDFNLR